MISSDDVFQRIESKLDQLLRLAALQMTTGLKQGAAIQLLAAAGFDRRIIAELLNTTPNTVSVTLSNSKAKTKQNAKAAKSSE
jgi:DNA-binding NarL/FixJ family response regulator